MTRYGRDSSRPWVFLMAWTLFTYSSSVAKVFMYMDSSSQACRMGEFLGAAKNQFSMMGNTEVVDEVWGLVYAIMSYTG